MKVQPTTKQLIAMLYERLPELLERPQRKPLTDEQADDIALEVMGFAVLDKEQAETARMLIRNTEAAHGITGEQK